MAQTNCKLVTLGGGTGSFTLLSALKHYTPHITAIVNMADNGGSSGKLRDEFGVLPPGDVRQCLVALADESSVVRELFNYRFGGEGELAGHSFGNLFLTALEQVTSDFAQAVQMASSVLSIQGKVVPVTLDDVNLVYQPPNGKKIKGEYAVANANLQANEQLPDLQLEPAGALNPAAGQAIVGADMVVIAPGSLYGSLAPTLLVEGMSQALSDTSATIVYVANLVNKPGQTDNFSVADYAAEIERFAKRPILDYVLYNTAKPTTEQLRAYAQTGEYAVSVDKQQFRNQHYRAIGAPLLSSSIRRQNANDTLIERTFIRHDGQAVARKLMELYSAI